MFEKNLNMSYLLDFYGEVLTERKKEVLGYYYNDDLSLAEIAEELNISRQGVRDIIKKAEEELVFLEEKLHLAEKFRSAETLIERAMAIAKNLEGASDLLRELEALRAELA
ncbi:MAG: YlxM family DNA-binding protein [Clostridia bacterium]|nr:YlxM family DNA-binding protein [Clostridia bacterium]